MYLQVEVINKAAECEQLMELEPDEARKAAYRSLRDSWIKLANECELMSPGQVVREMADILLMQTNLEAAIKTTSAFER